MGDFPLFLVCGTYDRSKRLDPNNMYTCPVCKTKNSVIVEQNYQRCCFCFIPLCVVGPKKSLSRCTVCGSVMPAIALQAPRI